MPYISPSLTAIASAVKRAAIAVTRDFNELEHLQSSINNDGIFASRSAEKVEKTLKEELAKSKPYPIVSKTTDAIPADGNYFLATSIDGYANFAHGNANFAISVALVENNTIVDAVIYSPIYDELFFAEKGCGAFKEGFRNHERLRVAGCKQPNRSLIAINADVENLQKALTLSSNITIKGSVALDLAYLASGKLDIVISSKNAPAKIAAGILLIKESGGYIFSIGDKDIRSEDLNKVLFSGEIVATNEALRQKVAETMAK